MEWIKTILNAVRVAMDGVSTKVDRLNAWAKTFAWVPVMSVTEDVILQNAKLEFESDGIVFSSTVPTVGVTYDVTINGKTYKATAWQMDNDGQKMTLIGEYMLTTKKDLPFLFGWVNGQAMFLYDGMKTGDTFVVSIAGRRVKAEKLPDVFIPDQILDAMENAARKTDPVFTGTFSQNRKADSTIGDYSHAEGHGTIASGASSHAEGDSTKASGDYSHAEGRSTTASWGTSHAEGYNTTASGASSHAEGVNTKASGASSHAEGDNTTASGDDSHVQGKYNIEDKSRKYAHIVGNGTAYNKRSNAHTLDWAGVPWFQGRPQFGGTAQDNGSQSVVANGDKEFILASSTEGSTKKFKITVDDSGVLTATEITN